MRTCVVHHMFPGPKYMLGPVPVAGGAHGLCTQGTNSLGRKTNTKHR